MILVIEPVFPNAHHAPGNSGILQAIRLAADDEPVMFAAHPAHRAAVFAVMGEAEHSRYSHRDIEVIPAGGVSFRRFRSQAGSLFRLIRELRPRVVVCLGTQPETLFACRLLTMIHRDLQVIAVLHGNLHDAAAGWRSRDPRRRWFDNRASLTAAIGSPRIQFVVLAQSVRDAALSLRLLPAARVHVWSHPISDREIRDGPHRVDPARIRIAFLGSAKRAKGFGDFAAMTRRLAARHQCYEFSLIGGMQEPFPSDDLSHLDVPGGFLEREDFMERLSAVDYVCLPFRDDTYTLTVSGVVLDAIAALKPVIALPTPEIRVLFETGPAGFLCNDLASMEAVMDDPARLADPILYQSFRDTLARQRRERSTASLSHVVARLIAPRDDRQAGVNSSSTARIA